MNDYPYVCFLVACLSGGGDQFATERLFPRWNWDKLVQTAADEGVLSAMHDALTTLGLEDQLPMDAANLFSTVTQLNRERNRRILSDLKRIARLLNDVGIEPLVLKGAAYLLSGIYADMSIRFLADVDLLLPESDFPAAIKILNSYGYICQSAHPVETIIGNAYPPLCHPDAVEIDLHRSLCMGPCKSLLPASEVLNKSVLHDLDGARVRVPSPEHLVIHHIVHSQIHDFYRERIRPSLRNLFDMVLLRRRFGSDIDWPAIEKRFRINRRFDAFALYLRQIENTLGVASPLPIRMTGLLQFRCWRRSVLRKAPCLRFLDPRYLFMAGVMPRTPLREVINSPGGWKFLLQKPFTKALYARRFAALR